MAGADDRARLERDLRVAAERPLSDFFKQARGRDERDHPTLARTIKTIVGSERWHARPNQALLDVTWDAIQSLPKHIAVRDGRRTRPPVPARGKPERDMAAILYGYADDELPPRFTEDGAEAEARTYDGDYRPAALRFAQLESLNKRDQGRTLEVIRQDLADQLLKMEQEAIAAQATADEGTETVAGPFDGDIAAQAPFIPRPELTKRFEELWRIAPAKRQWQTTHRLCIVGEAGTGKTRFIREYTADDVPVWIDAGADETMLPGMIDLLTDYGVHITGFDTPRVKHAFGQLLARTDGPKFVIIDGIPDPFQLDQFIPKATHSRLIVISRKRPPKEWAPIVEFTDMDASEAAAMATSRLPELTSKDSNTIAAIFGNRPLLIEHACRYIEQTGATDIQAFCHAVGQDIAAAIGAIGDPTEVTLTAINRQYIDLLRQRAPHSVELLELLCFVSHVNVPQEYAMSYLLGVHCVTPDLLARAQLAYDAAIGPLMAYSLVSLQPGYGSSMQPLTQHILRGVFSDRFPEIFERALCVLDYDGDALHAAGWHILTFAGRMTCNHVLMAHLRHRTLRHQWPTPAGAVGGVQWVVLVTELWKRMRSLSAFWWIPRTAWQTDTSSTPGYLWAVKELLAEAEGRPPIQADEIRAIADDLGNLVGTAVGENSLALQRESYLGQLDLSIFFRLAPGSTNLLAGMDEFPGPYAQIAIIGNEMVSLQKLTEAERHQRLLKYVERARRK